MANKNTAFRLPEELLEALDKIADNIGGSRTDVVIDLLNEGITRTQEGSTVLQRQTAISKEEIEDAFERLATPLVRRIEELESKTLPSAKDKVTLQAYQKKIIELESKLARFQSANSILEESLKFPSNNGSPIKKAIRNYLTAVEPEYQS